jgi:hypothetical protein
MNRSVAASESRAAAPVSCGEGVGPPTTSRTRPLRPQGGLDEARRSVGSARGSASNVASEPPVDPLEMARVVS